MDANDIKNLVFFLIAAAAWAIQAAMKRKQDAEERSATQEERAERAAQRRAQATVNDAAALEGEPDIVYGRRALPPRYAELSRTAPNRTAPSSTPAPPPVPKTRPAPPLPPRPMVDDTTSRPAPGSSTLTSSSLRSAGADAQLGQLAGRRLEGRLQATEAARVERNQAGRHARRRLRIDALGGTRAAMRTAILWNEVLGPPLAVRGPHHWKPLSGR